MIKSVNFRDDPEEIGVVNKLLFDPKIIDIVLKLHARNFINISRVEMIRLGLFKSLILSINISIIVPNLNMCVDKILILGNSFGH